MSKATYMALGAAAIGLAVTFFALWVARSAQKKKAAAEAEAPQVPKA